MMKMLLAADEGYYVQSYRLILAASPESEMGSGNDPICDIENGIAIQETPNVESFTPMEDQVRLAAYHLDGDVQLWFQQQKQLVRDLSWAELQQGLLERYGTSQFENYFADFCKLKQVGTVRDYQNQFDKLLAKAGKLTHEQEVGCFLSGLKEQLRADIQAQRPATLSDAIGLAKVFESRIEKEIDNPLTNVSNSQSLLKVPKEDFDAISVRRFSQAELQQRRRQGLCFHCDEKYTATHECKKLFLIELEQEVDNEGREKTIINDPG